MAETVIPITDQMIHRLAMAMVQIPGIEPARWKETPIEAAERCLQVTLATKYFADDRGNIENRYPWVVTVEGRR